MLGSLLASFNIPSNLVIFQLCLSLVSLVARTVHHHCTNVGSIPAGGPIVDDCVVNCSCLEIRHVYDFYSRLREIYHLDLSHIE